MSFHEPKDPEENLPDWLKELRRRQREAGQDQAAESPPEASPPEEASPQDTEPSEAAPPSPPPGEEPNWLLEIRRRHDKEAPSRPAARGEPDAQGEPDISDTQPNVPIQPGEIPGLDEDAFPEETAPIGWDAEPLISDPDEDDSPLTLPPPPAWLGDLDNEDEVAAEPEEPAVDDSPASETEAAPDWLSAIDEEQDPPTDEAELDDEADPELPDWLASEMASGEDAALQDEAPAASPPGTGDLPNWLLLGDAEDDSAHAQAFEGAGEDSGIQPGELPSWLQALRPAEAEQIVRPASSSALLPEQESVGPLAGLSGILPAEPEIVRIGTPRALSGRLQVSEGQQRHAATLNRLVAEEGRAKEDFSQQVAGPSRILNWVIAGALLLASAIPWLTGSQTAARPQLDSYPETEAVFNAIERLPANAPVLVAFDVQPALFGELEAPATQVLAHLLAGEARLVFISTQPTGPALVETLLADNLSIEPSIATGNYLNLGYLSGGIAALRGFASNPQAATSPLPGLPNNPWDSAPLNVVNRLDDFGLVLVISSETEEARAWIEQTASSLQEGLYMVASAQVAPLARPYLDSHPQTLRGLVSGLSGGAYYELIRGGTESNLGWDAFSYGLGAMVVAILLGGLYNRLIHLRPDTSDEAADA